MVQITKKDDGKRGRFALFESEQFAAEMTFVWAGDKVLIIDHTGVEDEYRGKNYGRKLFLTVMEFAREKGVKVKPLCPFAKAEFEKLSEFSDLLV